MFQKIGCSESIVKFFANWYNVRRHVKQIRDKANTFLYVWRRSLCFICEILKSQSCFWVFYFSGVFLCYIVFKLEIKYKFNYSTDQ